MDVQIDLRVTELLASRLCHDLVGPIGAVNNGLELLADEIDDMGPEALKLASDSAARAARALQYFRFAYGMAGSRVGGNLDELRELAVNFFGSEKVKLSWLDQPLPAEVPENLGKLLLNMLLVGVEALPMGGRLAAAVADESGGLRVSVTATGDKAALRPETMPALAPGAKPEDLTPRNVQAYFTCRIAERMGGALTVAPGAAGTVTLTATLLA